jgi:hypothetical protein
MDQETPDPGTTSGRDRLACPACATGFGTTRTVAAVGACLRRERRCIGCGHAWTTIETACVGRPAAESALIEAASHHLAAAMRALTVVAGRGVRQPAPTGGGRARSNAKRRAEDVFGRAGRAAVADGRHS